VAYQGQRQIETDVEPEQTPSLPPNLPVISRRQTMAAPIRM
jgi:hypothetical protein